MKMIPTSNNMRLLVRHIREEVVGPFWEAQEQSRLSYNQELRGAKKILNNTKIQIDNAKKRSETANVSVSKSIYPIERIIQKTNEFKNELKAEVTGITDLTQEIEACILKKETQEKEIKHVSKYSNINVNDPIILPRDYLILAGIAAFGALVLAIIGDSEVYPIIIILLLVSVLLVLLGPISFLTIKKKIKKIVDDYYRSEVRALLLLECWQEQSENEYAHACTEAEQRHTQRFEEIRKRFFPLVDEVSRRVKEFKARSGFPEVAAWEHQCWQNWDPGSKPPLALRFGTLKVDTSSKQKRRVSKTKFHTKKTPDGAFHVIDEHGELVGICKDEDELVALEDELVALEDELVALEDELAALNKGHLFRLGGKLFYVGDKERYSSYDVITEAFMRIR
ncbi:hypothetical protein M1N60_01165 [Thermodesulfovibrionales bacterium]|nr:hypothetical protein [Thermodesulfovibrionales bacterium]